MKKLISSIVCTALICASAFAQGRAVITSKGLNYGNQPHGMRVYDTEKGIVEGSPIKLSENENAIEVNFSSAERKAVMEYYISLYDRTDEKYITATDNGGMPVNMVGPVVEEGKFRFTGLAGGHEYEIRIATAVNSRNLNVEVSALALDCTDSNEFNISDTSAYVENTEKDVSAGFAFKGDSNITRSEMTMLIKNLFPVEVERVGVFNLGPEKFSDISADTDGYNAIVDLKNLQVINGVGGGLFAPDAPVTNAQAVKMLVSAMGYGAYAEDLGGWPQGYIKCGELLGISTEKPGDDPALWEDVEKMLRRAYSAPHMCLSEFSAGGSGVFYQSPNISYEKMN